MAIRVARRSATPLCSLLLSRDSGPAGSDTLGRLSVRSISRVRSRESVWLLGAFPVTLVKIDLALELPVTGVWILVIVLALASAFGLWRKATDGRMKDADAHPCRR